MWKHLRRNGLDKSNPHKPIEEAHMEQIWDSGVLDKDNPKGLSYRVFMEVMVHFVRRGAEGLRELTQSSFTFSTDGEGEEYVKMSYREYEKTDNGGDEKIVVKEAVMYEEAEDPNFCPVRLIRLYLSKINHDIPEFFQTPNPHYLKSGRWYKKSPVGKVELGKYMSQISQKAKLSVEYKNHDIRTTACVEMDKSGANPREICSFSGHKDERSLKSYISKTPLKRKKEISKTLHQFGKSKKLTKTQDKENATPMGPPLLPPVPRQPPMGPPLLPPVPRQPPKQVNRDAPQAPAPPAAAPPLNPLSINTNPPAQPLNINPPPMTGNIDSLGFLSGLLKGAQFHGTINININLNNNH